MGSARSWFREVAVFLVGYSRRLRRRGALAGSPGMSGHQRVSRCGDRVSRDQETPRGFRSAFPAERTRRGIAGFLRCAHRPRFPGDGSGPGTSHGLTPPKTSGTWQSSNASVICAIRPEAYIVFSVNFSPAPATPAPAPAPRRGLRHNYLSFLEDTE